MEIILTCNTIYIYIYINTCSEYKSSLVKFISWPKIIIFYYTTFPTLKIIKYYINCSLSLSPLQMKANLLIKIHCHPFHNLEVSIKYDTQFAYQKGDNIKTFLQHSPFSIKNEIEQTSKKKKSNTNLKASSPWREKWGGGIVGGILNCSQINTCSWEDGLKCFSNKPSKKAIWVYSHWWRTVAEKTWWSSHVKCIKW